MKFLKNKLRKDFLEILPKDSIGAEIGVFKGNFSKNIKDIVNPRKLHLIDPWWTDGEEEWIWDSGNQGNKVDAYIKIVKYFENDIIDGKVVINIVDDLKYLPKISDNYFDWVYLDTTHQYEQTKKELEILKDKVKNGGLIAGHDWRPNPKHKHHGVFKAVNEFLKRYPYELIYLDNFLQWCIRKI